MNNRRRYLYLIKRGPRPASHRAPFHPVIICDLKRVALWEAGWSGEQSWVWSNDNTPQLHSGWLLERWQGLDIDYGGLVKGLVLPDGSTGAFWHYDNIAVSYIPGFQALFRGAVWWSDREMPKELARRGVIYPMDKFSRQRILDDLADDGASGFSRAEPTFWPEAMPDEELDHD